MTQYQFEQIIRRTEQRFGKIKKGTEEDFTPIFSAIESNMMLVNRDYPEANGRRAREAVLLALHTIEGRLTGQAKDLSSFENRENLLLLDAILYAIDPTASEDGMEGFLEAGGAEEDLQDPEYLGKLYTLPAQCLLRLMESIDKWTKEMGPNGYFLFMEDTIGSQIGDDRAICLALPEND